METNAGKIRDIMFKDGKPISIKSDRQIIELTPEEQALILGK